jgi:hypothetical protein
MKFDVRIDTAQARAQLKQWGGQYLSATRPAVERALRAQSVPIKAQMRAQVQSAFSVKRRSFAASFTTRIYARDTSRLPALWVGSRVPWVGVHETGGTISARMLIPLHGRVGRKRFKAQIDALMRAGNAYFVKNAKGNIVLMAENLREQDRVLSGFKRRYRKAEGVKRLKRGQDIPIAVLVRRVTLRKRLDITALIQRHIAPISAAVQRELLRNSP